MSKVKVWAIRSVRQTEANYGGTGGGKCFWEENVWKEIV